MNNIFTIGRNMVKRTIGSHKGLLLHILLPSLVVAGIVSVTGGMEDSAAVLLYTNKDTGAAGNHLIVELENSGDYKLVERSDEADLKEGVTSQDGAAGLWIPEGFTSGILQGKAPQLTVYELKTTEDSMLIKMKTDAIAVEMLSTAATVRKASATGSMDSEERFTAILKQAEEHNVGSIRTDYNLYPRQTLGVITGMTLMFLMSLVTSSVSLIMADRRGRTMMRMFSAPVRSYEIALGNFLGSFMVGLIQIAAVLALGKWVLRYDYEVPMYLYFLVLAAFMLVSMGIAGTVAGLIRNPNNTGMLNTLILTPSCMLGGCFWPLSIMPDYMQKAANFMPQKWAIQAVDIAAAGGGWDELWLPFAILGLMAVILLAVGSAILRPNEAGINA
ncbi:ABC transporter [Paenibacillus sp. FSL H7-0357]|uniref:ABC transporter permease n=1 Tax=Paenibacillus sp. FSL H7-0357 TaxID=1536774 RepID=UPI0004F6B722|nr:ABC transporter permease [Paenibacillus sp. FSL H7-0357]AIQ20863.1 ABC transporter [Paenibacillus sp. FSL H7-0357]